MSYRFTLAAVAAVLALTGCAKRTTAEQAPDFSSGATLVTVTHIPAKTDDGTKVFVTVDGNDAGILDTGDSIAVHLPAGKHQVGGYARSLIGRVTIPAVEVTTSPDSERHVAYSVANLKPTFSELSPTPVQVKAPVVAPEAPKEPAPQIQENVPAETSVPQAPTAAEMSTTATTPETQAAPAVTAASPAVTQTSPAATTQATPNVTELTQTPQATTTTQDKQTPEVTDLTQSPQA